MTLSRCGRVYPTFDAAYKAAELKSFKGAATKVVSCSFGDHWHAVGAAEFAGQQKRYRPDPFPPVVQRQMIRRDEQCQGCGNASRVLHKHHRRAKASGGSGARQHTQCACNGLLLCLICHKWAHEHPADARHYGWIVLQSVAEPRLVEVLRYAFSDGHEDHEPDKFWPTCDGQWVHSPLETE